MSLYFIRHGQTVLNSQRKFNGEVDESLSEIGFKQAEDAGENVRKLKLDLVYCSPLLRTRQTLQGLKLASKIPVIFDERLVERREGELAGRDIDDNMLHNVYLNRYNKVKIDRLETIDDAFARVHGVLKEIEENHKDKNVLIVAHGFVGRAVYFYFHPVPESGKLGDVPESFVLNCQLKKFEFNEKELEIE